MAKYIGPKCKLSRREGMDLLLKSRSRSLSEKCKADSLPGMQGERRPRVTDYGVQLREKQKLRRMYGVLERQFRGYYKKAAASKSASGEALISLLESRLDNVVYRMGFAATRAEARQLVSHKSIALNGKVVNIPSVLIEKGDEISVRECAKTQLRIKEALRVSDEMGFVGWVDVDVKGMSGIFHEHPHRSEVLQDINESLVIEFYSK